MHHVGRWRMRTGVSAVAAGETLGKGVAANWHGGVRLTVHTPGWACHRNCRTAFSRCHNLQSSATNEIFKTNKTKLHHPKLHTCMHSGCNMCSSTPAGFPARAAGPPQRWTVCC
eukprot:357833-Chlamydomonas_euryale.AAC.7